MKISASQCKTPQLGATPCLENTSPGDRHPGSGGYANTTMLCRLSATGRPSGATIQVDWLV